METIIAQLTFIGLLTDIAGGVFISKSVFYKRNKDIFDSSGGSWGYSREKAFDGILAKREALVGCVLLLVGFIGQFIGAIESSKPVNWFVVLVYGLCLAVLSLCASWLLKKWSSRTVNELVAAYKE